MTDIKESRERTSEEQDVIEMIAEYRQLPAEIKPQAAGIIKGMRLMAEAMAGRVTTQRSGN